MRFPISTMRSLRHFEMYFKPQQLSVITLISVGAKDSMAVFVSEVGLMEDVRGGFWGWPEVHSKKGDEFSIIGNYT